MSGNRANRRHAMELADILAPVTLEHFLADYWAHKPLHITGTPDKFAPLFSFEAWRQALREISTASADPITVRASFADGPLFPVEPRQAESLLDAGATICITDLHRFDDQLDALTGSVKDEFNYTGTVGVHCYVSPPGSGLRTHFDARVATTLQIAGRKIWHFSNAPAVPYPRSNVRVLPDGTAVYGGRPGTPQRTWEAAEAPVLAEQERVELSAGDLLCLPAGTWHSACATERSLALNLYFQELSLADQLADSVRDALEHVADYRAGFAPVPRGPVRNGRLTQRERQRMLGAIDTAIERLNALKRDEHKADELRIRAIVQRNRTEAATVDTPAVRRDTRLQLARTAAVRMGMASEPDGGEAVCAYSGDAVVSLPGHAYQLMVEIFQRESFDAESVLSWDVGDFSYDWDDIQAVLTVLVQARVLEPRP